MKSKRLLIVGAAVALAISGCAGATRVVRNNPLKTTADGAAATSITSGKKYLVTAVYNGTRYYLTPGASALAEGAVLATSIANVSTATEAMCWTFAGSGTSWTIQANGFYLANTDKNNGVKTNSNSQSWTSSFSGSVLTLTGGNSRKLALYQGSNWRCYSSTSGVQSLAIYEYAASTNVVATYSSAYGTLSKTSDSVSPGSSITMPTISNKPSDFSFGGFSDGTSVYSEGQSVVLNENKTFTAIWTEIIEEGVDALNRSFTGISSGAGYSDWSGKTGDSGAVYSGNSAGGNDSIQLRSDKDPSGVIVTTSVGYVRKVSVVWNGSTSSGRTINIYGKNAAYLSVSELYNASSQGDLLGTIVCGTSTSITIEGDYRYVGVRSSSGALYLESLKIKWEDAPVFGELDHINISTPATQTTFYVGETFNSDGLVLIGYDAYDESTALTELYSSGFTTDFDGKVFESDDIEEGITVTVTYNTKTTFYYINVQAPIEKNVAEALEIINGLEDNTIANGMYLIEGYITLVEYNWSSNNGITYLLADDVDSDDTIKVFKSSVEGGQAVGQALKKGDYVEVLGKLEKYVKNSDVTPEIVQGTTSLIEAGPVEKITVVEALEIANALESGASSSNEYRVDGYIVSIVTAWNDEHSNITYMLGDAADASTTIEVYRSTPANGTDGAHLRVGDQVSVVGYLTNYGGTTPEFAAHCLTSLLEPSSNFEAYLSSASSVARIYGDEEFDFEDPATAELVFANITPALENAVQYSDPFNIGDGTTKITFAGGENDGKYYTTGSGIRTYNGGTITISSSTAYITSIEFTWSGSNKPSSDDVANIGSYDSSTGVWSGEAKTVVLTKSDSDAWRLQGVKVSYQVKTFISVSNVAIRFGARFEKDVWDTMASKFTILDYGVKLFRRSATSTNPTLTVAKAFEDGLTLATVHSGSGAAPYYDEENGEYVFNARINFSNSDYYSIVYVAAPFIVIDDGSEDGKYYFLDEVEYSVKSLAQHYVGDATYQYLSQDALKELAK